MLDAISRHSGQPRRSVLRYRPRIPLDRASTGAGLPGVPYVPNLPGVARGHSDAGDSGYGGR